MKLFTFGMALFIAVVSLGFVPLFGDDMFLIEDYDYNPEIFTEELEVSCAIVAFDVNDNGWYVLGLQEIELLFGGNHYICVYDNNGVFQFGFKYPAGFYVELDNELNVYVYHYKSRVQECAIVNKDGLVSAYGYSSSKAFNNDVEGLDEYEYTRKVKGVTYEIRNDFIFLLDMLTMDCSKMVKIESNGTETVLYDSGNYYWPILLVGVLLAFGFVAIIIFNMIKYIKNYQKGIIFDRNEYHPDHCSECGHPGILHPSDNDET